MGSAVRTFGNVRIFTPAYGAPEQFDERVGSIGPWTDVYAVGLVVLEVLTDRAVVEGEHIGELAAKALDRDRRPTPRAFGVAIGDEVESALARAVAFAPGERPQDAGELWGLLKHAIASDGASGRLPHARDVLHIASPATFRIPHPLPEGPLEPAVEVVRSELPSEVPGQGQGLGGTLRMSSAPRNGLWIAAGGKAGALSPIGHDGRSHSAPASDPPPRPPFNRTKVVVALALVVVVLGAIALWLLGTRSLS
jgi:serine/threonine protein kinase